MDLTYVNSTYTKELKANIEEITEMVYDHSITLALMKKNIRAIMSPAFIYKNAKPRFYGYLSKCRSKAEVLRLCNNAINKAEHYYGGR